MRRFSAGLTLIEMLATLVVMIVLAATVVPTVSSMREKQRIAAATEAVNAQVMLAKSESGKRSETIHVAIDTGSAWAVGVSDVAGCDPSGTTCTLNYVESNGSVITKVQAINGSDYPNTTIAGSSPGDIAFDPVRGTTLTDNGSDTVIIQSDSYQTRVVVSAFGQVRVCSPSGSNKLGRYPDC